tara:strand:- start:62 stop:550 length:489 start_codon:yes stop_codon:yes gene_type:complete
MKKLSLYVFLCLFISNSVFANQVNIKLVSYKDEEAITGHKLCSFQFEYTNNSWGTIYNMPMHVVTYNDRDEQVEETLITNKIGPNGIYTFESSKIKEPLLVGSKTKNWTYTVISKCEYVRKIIITEPRTEDCNIRMMPEEATCKDIIKTTSDIDHIELIEPK